MKNILIPLIITCVLFLYHSYKKEKMAWYRYLLMIVFMIGIMFLGDYFFTNKAYANERDLYFEEPLFPDSKREIKYLKQLGFGILASLNKEDKKFYQQKVEFHLNNAERTYRDAKKRCAFLPDVDYRKKAEHCFIAAGNCLIAGTPQSKIIAGLMTLLLSYGIDVMQEWDYIQNKLHWSEYHYEMMEFYQEVLKKE